MKFLKNNKILDIQEANENDAADLSVFLKQVKEESTFIVLRDSGVSKSEEELFDYLKELKNKITSKLFLGKVDGEIVASGGIYHRAASIEGNVVLDINVLKAYLGVGTEEHILNHVINYARITAEIKSIDILTKANEEMVKIYQGLGFNQISSQKEDVSLKANKSELVYRLEI